MPDPNAVWPVYVPSKGRSASIKLPEAVPAMIVVEPGEADAYRDALQGRPASILLLPANDPGLPFVRNWIKDHATAAGFSWYWMIDDDVRRYSLAVSGKNQPTDACTALLAAQAVIDRFPLAAQGGLEYQQFAWSSRKDAIVQSYCDVAVAIHTGRTAGLRFRDVSVKVDRDFTLQVLASGWHTVRAARVGFECPAMGTNPGGLADEYARHAELQAADQLARLWPGVVTVRAKRNGTVDAAITWSAFRVRL